MNIPDFHSSHVMTGVLFFIAMVPFIVIRLGSALTATTSSGPRKDRRHTKSLIMGSGLGVIIIFSPFMAASAQEVFVIFTEAGPELYQVDTVQEPNLTLNQYNGGWWSEAAPIIRMDPAMFMTLSVTDNRIGLLLGFQAMAATGGFGTTAGRIDWSLPQPQREIEKQVGVYPFPRTDSLLTRSQRMVQKDNAESPSLLSN